MDLNYPIESLSSDDGQIQMNGKYHKYIRLFNAVLLVGTIKMVLGKDNSHNM